MGEEGESKSEAAGCALPHRAHPCSAVLWPDKGEGPESGASAQRRTDRHRAMMRLVSRAFCSGRGELHAWRHHRPPFCVRLSRQVTQLASIVLQGVSALCCAQRRQQQAAGSRGCQQHSARACSCSRRAPQPREPAYSGSTAALQRAHRAARQQQGGLRKRRVSLTGKAGR